jgi:hypothetical protein
MTAYWYYVMGQMTGSQPVEIDKFITEYEAENFCNMLQQDAIDGQVFYVVSTTPE